MNIQVEICCGSYYDARQVEARGAKRIELSGVLHAGGLTPSMATPRLTREHTKLNVMIIIRSCSAGFHYLSQDYDVMVEEIRDMIKNGAGGIVFGCLDTYGNIDTEQSGHITVLAKVNHKQVVLYRALDYVKDPFKAIETLTNIGVDRVLTSGICPTVFEGKEIIRQLQERHGDWIEILAGYGIDAMNAKGFIVYTGVKQIHSSCKDWSRDGTTCDERVTHSYGSQGHKSDYEIVNGKKVEYLIRSV